MYKTVNLSEETYQQLHRISTQLNRPKARVIEFLIRDYGEITRIKEAAKLTKFNREMKDKIGKLNFSKKIKVNTSNIDADFAALAKTSYVSD